MRKVLEDVNLEAIVISSDGRELTFEFSDMVQRRRCADLVCKSTYLFRYDNAFVEAGDGLPCYVGEVGLEDLGKSELQKRLHTLNYGIGVDVKPWKPDPSTRIARIPLVEHAFVVHIEGAIVIDAVCAQLDFNEKKNGGVSEP
jgi:hypothetical protein